MITIIIRIIEVFIIFVPILISIAYLTLAERKIMGSMQSRLGPNKVGYLGLLQPISDGIKLIVKERILPYKSNKIIFLLSPFISFLISLLSWIIIPFQIGYSISDFNLAILFILAISSLTSYGIIFGGWSSNNKYSLLGSIRTSGQLISYEIIIGLIILPIIFIVKNMNINNIIEFQYYTPFFIPLLPFFLFFFIAILAETSRSPFDLPESESELVAGFFTEYSSLPFAIYFLGEYGSIIFISAFTTILFFGNTYPLLLGFNTSFILFLFILVRASYPRLRYDQLMKLSWVILLPLILGLLTLLISILILII